MSSQKPRIIPWLIQQIDSQKYPGLVWLNDERTQFRIPWKHGLRQDRSEEDVKIFEAWAIASCSYNPTKDAPNPPVWKRNVRSALNRKAGIRVIHDCSTNSINPHKIYEISRMNNPEGNAATEEYVNDIVSPTSDQSTISSPQSAVSTVNRNLSEDLTQMQISHNEEDLYSSPANPGSAEELNNPLSLGADLYTGVLSPDIFVAENSPIYHDLSSCTPSDVQSVQHYLDESKFDLTTQAQQCEGEEEDVCPEAVGPGFAPFALLTLLDTLYVPGGSEPQPESLHGNLELLFPNKTFQTDFDVKIYYRGTLVRHTVVKNPHGFCITSRQEPKPGNFLEDVILPIPYGISDQGVASKITELLENLEHGTLVEVRDGSICAKRQGKCRSYWSMTDTPTIWEPNQIDKRDYSILYSMQQFVTELIDFIEGGRRESPEYSIWICLGELWPENRPWKKKLIMIQITPVVMQMLHELSYRNGASSLHSDELNLQISGSLSFSSTAEMLPFLRDLQEMMDILVLSRMAKPLLIPWLIEQIESQQYPGLVWLDSERSIFRVPWKHGLRKDRSSDDIGIFEAWAVESGLYNPSKDKPDPARWKRNFRSALIQKDGVRMIKNNSSETFDPHKIYQISQVAAGNLAATDHHVNDVNPYLEQLSLGSFSSDLYSDAMDQVLAGGLMDLQISQGGEHLPDITAQEPENVVESIIRDMLLHNTLETQFDVSIYYRGTLIKNTSVKNPHGFHITSRQQPNSGGYLEDLVLPIPSEIGDQNLARKLRCLFDNLEYGTLIEVRDQTICGKREGKCKSFWTMTETPTEIEPNEIHKTDYTVLYSMPQFVTELIPFMEGGRTSPLYSIWICLGETWPDSRPWKEKLIMLKVTPVAMKMLHDLSYCGGATSLRSDELNLQISDSLSSSSLSDVLSVLKGIAEDMEYD
ncbi:interferon regulatory factor 3 [Pelodytes ibericus]